MIRVAVCDDDPVFRKQAESMISRWGHTNTVCEVFDNGDALIVSHKISPFDIILLDIVMPMINGIETAREIRTEDKRVMIVFLTSSSEFAVESYSVKANNYLLKPISEDLFFRCLDELYEEITQNTKTIFVKGLYSVHKLVVDNIVYIEALNRHTVFTMVDGTKIETTEPLHVLEEKFSGNKEFFKCHRSYVINMNFVDTYTSKEARMHSGCIVPISRNYQKSFESAFFSILFGEAGVNK